MGVLAHRLRTLDRSLVPPSTRAEIFRHMCLQSHLQTSPPTPHKSYPKFQNPITTFETTPLWPSKYSIVYKYLIHRFSTEALYKKDIIYCTSKIHKRYFLLSFKRSKTSFYISFTKYVTFRNNACSSCPCSPFPSSRFQHSCPGLEMKFPENWLQADRPNHSFF